MRNEVIILDFRKLKKFLDSLRSEYGITGCDLSVYYNHIYVFRHRAGTSSDDTSRKVSRKDLYFFHSGAKLICCVALMQLAEQYKLTLSDKVCSFISGFDEKVTVKEFISLYSSNLNDENSAYNHKNVVALIEKASGMDFNEYIVQNITGPLKMKSTTFELTEKNKSIIASQLENGKKTYEEREAAVAEIYTKSNGSLITTVEDYAILCEVLCNKGEIKRGRRLLSDYSVDTLINGLIYNETEKEDAYVSVGYHGNLILIDIKKKITIVYAQHKRQPGDNQHEMYPKLRRLVYECIGVDTWSRGYNIFN